ncbi:hypothetical protein PVK06_011632 [Gossypium arboreum]|uniref:HAT C-terminal dimerisation domain-containing protein n=1 Tax=Gossypium arboreum TaxID=29729 RepID=A0ABR0Q9I0_GOSAR|nr:hypothetical protein PVK06_011632 [Gossypium arboreum]
MASLNTPILVDDGFNEYEITLKRQKSTTSKVWDEMTKLECETKNELKAQCNQSILCDGAFCQVRCCAHILNLIVKAGLELADDVFDFVETILSNLRLLFDNKSSVLYNELSLLARDLLAILISTVASTSAFSMEIGCKNGDDDEDDVDDEDNVSSISF